MLDKEISEAIRLLKDDNLVWSFDFELIRKDLCGLLEKILQNEYHWLEPELADLVLKLNKEGENIVRESRTTAEENILRHTQSI